MKRIFLLLSVIAACTTTPARATILEWQLENSFFTDGGTLTGTFSVDTVTASITSYNLITTNGSTLSGAVYDSAFGLIDSINFFGANPNSIVFLLPSTTQALNLSFDNSFFSPGKINLITAPNATGSFEFDTAPTFRLISGSAVAIPEPATVQLTFLGIAGLASAMRRKNTTKLQ